MYNECITCPKLGQMCDGPNFLNMSAAELSEWCKERKKHLGLSNQRIAEIANMSKGTVDGLLANAHNDFRYETIRPVLKALIGGEWGGHPCDAIAEGERAEMLNKIQQYEAEIKWREERFQRLSKENARLADDLKSTQTFLRGEIKRKNKTIAVLGMVAGVALAVIIAALVIDRINSDIGFFWLGQIWPNLGNQAIKHTWG